MPVAAVIDCDGTSVRANVINPGPVDTGWMTDEIRALGVAETPAGRLVVPDAAGLPVLAGLVRYDEVAAGRIDHAIRITVPASEMSIT